MCSYELKLLDSVFIQKSILCNKALSYTLDNHYCVIVEDGLFILQLYGCTDNFLPIMSFNKKVIPLSPDTLKFDYQIKIDNSMLLLPRFEYYERILCLDLDEDLKINNKKIPQYIQAEWSPCGLLRNDQSALASLTNTSTLNIFVCTTNEIYIKEYAIKVNIAELCFEYFKESWTYVPITLTSKLDELKRRLSEITLTCFTWSNLITLGNAKFCFLVLGHLNGNVSFWKFNQRECNEVNANGIKCVACYKTELASISTLHWQQGTGNDILFVGDANGRVKSVLTKLTGSDNLTFENELTLWQEVDDISVDMFKVYVYRNMIYLLIVKNNFLITYMFDSSGKLLDTHGVDLGNCRIICVEKFDENTIFILMYTGLIQEIKLSSMDNKINLRSRPIYVDFNWPDYNAHGLVISPNKVFVGILVKKCKIRTLKYNSDFTSFLIFANCKEDPVDLLMKNTSGSLRGYWDCIELERLRSVKEKQLPCLKLPTQLDYDKLPLVKLKTCYWIKKISEMISHKLPNTVNQRMLFFEELKQLINIKTIVDHMHHLLELFIKERKLSEFHMHTLYVSNMYLKEILQHVIPKLNTGENLLKELFNVIQASRELVYPSVPVCSLCEQEIKGISCTPPHLDTRCHISLMQIVDLPYYKCGYCLVTVHIRMRDIYDVVLCPYCDIPLEVVSLQEPSRISEEGNLSIEENSSTGST